MRITLPHTLRKRRLFLCLLAGEEIIWSDASWWMEKSEPVGDERTHLDDECLFDDFSVTRTMIVRHYGRPTKKSPRGHDSRHFPPLRGHTVIRLDQTRRLNSRRLNFTEKLSRNFINYKVHSTIPDRNVVKIRKTIRLSLDRQSPENDPEIAILQRRELVERISLIEN